MYSIRGVVKSEGMCQEKIHIQLLWVGEPYRVVIALQQLE